MLKVMDYTRVPLQTKKFLQINDSGAILGEFDTKNWLKNNALALKDQSSGASLRIRVLASMSGVLVNRRVYPGEEWAKAAPFFAERPFLPHHNYHADSLGRIELGEFEQKRNIANDFKKPQVQELGNKLRPSGIVYVIGTLTDPDTIAKALDKRILHVSQGSRAGKAECSICGADWADGHWCDHTPGMWYDKKTHEKVDPGAENAEMAFSVIRELIPIEVSFVNDAALREARILEFLDEMSDSQRDSWDRFTSEIGMADIVEQDAIDDLVLVDSIGDQVILRLADSKPIEITTSDNHPSQRLADNKDRRSLQDGDHYMDWEDKLKEKSQQVVDLKAELIDAKSEVASLSKRAETAESKASDVESRLAKATEEALQLKKDKEDLCSKYDELLEHLKDGLVERFAAILKVEDPSITDETLSKAKSDLSEMPLDIVRAIVENREAFRAAKPAPETAPSDINPDKGEPNKDSSKTASGDESDEESITDLGL